MNGAWASHDQLPPSNGFSHDGTFDPSMLSAANLNNAGQHANAPFPHSRSQTPSTAQFPYIPSQLVPSKRPREEGTATASPRPPHSHPALSRSQTPQQQGPYPGNNYPPPNAYQHLQHGGSNNATPSPTLSNSQYHRPAQQPAMAMSPPPQDGSGRGTPANPPRQFAMNGHVGAQMGAHMPGQQHYGMPGQMPPGYSQNYSGMHNMATQQGQVQGVQLPAHLAQQQRQAQMAMEQQRQMQQQRPPGLNPMMQQHMAAQQANVGTPSRQPTQMMPQHNQRQQMAERAFLEKISKFMQHSNKPFEAHPKLSGTNKSVNLFVLFEMVVRAGSSNSVTQRKLWPQIARNLGYPEEMIPAAGLLVQKIFDQNLGPWEAAYQHSRLAQMQKTQQVGQMPGMQQNHQGMSPTRPMPPQIPQNNQASHPYVAQSQQRMGSMPSQHGPSPPQMTPIQANASLPPANDYSTPQPDSARARPTSVEQQKKAFSQQMDGSPAPNRAPSFATPSLAKTPTKPEPKAPNGVNAESAEIHPRDQTDYEPSVRYMLSWDNQDPGERWGGLQLASDGLRDLADEVWLHDFREIPGHDNPGERDIQTLTLAIQSGIAAQVRHALDLLVKLTEPRIELFNFYFDLRHCEEFLEVLVDCAQDQIEILRDPSKRIEGLEPGSYEEITRLAKLEIQDIQDIPEADSEKYRKTCAANRLICVTAILRNLSFPVPRPVWQQRHDQAPPPDNTNILASSRVVKLLLDAIGLLATRVISLQSSINTQDFMKDVVLVMSNIAAEVVLGSQDEAYNFLQFILAFAPGPIPTETNPFRFASYRPAIHKYYPAAIDAFAKMLARDDPNRTFFKQIFVDTADHEDSEESDLPLHQQYDFLTRAFGMAIAAVPDVSGHERKPINRMDEEIKEIAAARKPVLWQAMLCADILSSLIPASDPALAKAWLSSQDGWGSMLFRVVTELAEFDGALDSGHQMQQGQMPPNPYRKASDLEDEGFVKIVSRAMSMLKRLARKALDDTANSSLDDRREEPEDGEDKTNGVGLDEASPSSPEATQQFGTDADYDEADTRISKAADFLPFSDSIFYGIFANTRGLTSKVIADYIALGEILH